MITIVLAEDHAVVREGLRVLLESESSFELVGEAGDGLEALRVVGKTQPDVLVADVMMPGLTGIEIARRVRNEHPATRVLILSMYANESYVLEALRNGAAGYVLKGSTSAELKRAIHEVAAGRRYLSPPLSERAIDAYLDAGRQAPADPYGSLTDREREVLKLAAEGRSNPEIATRLFISPRTVETHRANLMRKLGLHGQTELVRYALERGLLG